MKPVVETVSSHKSGITGSFQLILLIRDCFRLGVWAPCQGMHMIAFEHPQLWKTARQFCLLKLAIEPFVTPLPRLWDLCRLPKGVSSEFALGAPDLTGFMIRRNPPYVSRRARAIK